MQCPKKNTTSYLFSHGIAHAHAQAYWYTQLTPEGVYNERYTIPGRLFTFDFPDAINNFWQLNFTKTSLAQGNEIISLKRAYDETIAVLDAEKSINKDLVLVGLSRGASTTLSFMGLFNPKEVKALVLESPFDSIATLIQNILRNLYLHWVPGLDTVGHSLVSMTFAQHNKNGIRPLDTVDTIKKDLPILLICSEQDGVVPATSTMELYKKLQESGHQHTYIFKAHKGDHANILQDADGQNYQRVVHAFYKKYQLPHDSALADQGMSLLEQCQPYFAKPFDKSSGVNALENGQRSLP